MDEGEWGGGEGCGVMPAFLRTSSPLRCPPLPAASCSRAFCRAVVQLHSTHADSRKE
jgi:hypothetical protein